MFETMAGNAGHGGREEAGVSAAGAAGAARAVAEASISASAADIGRAPIDAAEQGLIALKLRLPKRRWRSTPVRGTGPVQLGQAA